VNAAAPDLPMYKATLDRNLEMQKEGIVSRQALDDANKDYLAALTRRDSSKAQIGVDTAKLKQARAQVQQSQASLKQLEEQLGYTTIVAPMDGVILSRDVEIGDAVSSILVLGSTATLVMTEGDINEVYVQGKVDEADIAHVYMGQPARIKVESFRDRTFNGKVTKIAPLGVEKDNVTTFEVRVSINNPGGELKANMTANAEILLDEHKGVLTVPENAVMYDNQKNASVEIPDKKQKEGKRKVPVKVGLSNGSVTEVVSGLKEGDQVVLQQSGSGNIELRNLRGGLRAGTGSGDIKVGGRQLAGTWRRAPAMWSSGPATPRSRWTPPGIGQAFTPTGRC
jgi:HlyD family secretion protein